MKPPTAGFYQFVGYIPVYDADIGDDIAQAVYKRPDGAYVFFDPEGREVVIDCPEGLE